MNLLSLADWPAARLRALLRLALEVKRRPERFRRALVDKTLLMVFDKPSLRTRVSFEVAMLRAGGHAIPYDVASSPWGAGKETPFDTARTASRYVDAILARLHSAADLRELARGATVPLINGLTDVEHPCQALGDLLTLLERFGRLEGLVLAYVGDGHNNVTHSLLDGCAKVGVDVRVGCPRARAFHPAAHVLARARAAAAASGSRVEVVHDARAAVAGADAVYTDTWMSYHIPTSLRAVRRRALTPFRVTRALLAKARPRAVFLHCLPALRGAEVTADVLDGPRSLVLEQAENRLHTEIALLLTLLGGRR